MPKKFGLPEGATPYEEMQKKYPDWKWVICPICKMLCHYRSPYNGMHPDCWDSPTAKRLLSKERNLAKKSQSVSLFGDELDPS